MSSNIGTPNLTDSANMNNIPELSFVVLLSVIIIGIIFLFLTQYCWNNTISVITKTPEITLFQSMLLLVLSHILFNNNCYCYVQK